MIQQKFQGRIVVLGHGSVSRCLIPLLMKKVSKDQIIVLDQDYKSFSYRSIISFPQTYTHEVTKQNIEDLFRIDEDRVSDHKFTQDFFPDPLLRDGDLLIDLAWNIDTLDFLKLCHKYKVNYINTSVELWNPYENRNTIEEQTLYWRHERIRKWWDSLNGEERANSPTMLVEHGANPGLVSHFVKEALENIALKQIQEEHICGGDSSDRYSLIEALSNSNHSRLSQELNVKTIHISERDTQVTHKPKQKGEFVNTWSIEGFYEEGIAPAEMGWGTHEIDYFSTTTEELLFHFHNGTNRALMTNGISTFVKSWVPTEQIHGMIIRHGEAVTISDHLSVREVGSDEVVYRPTVHYAYLPCDAALASLHEMKMHNNTLQSKLRILNSDEIESGGQDILGVLLMGHKYKSWWTGSLLSIDEAERLAPRQNATTLQVAASVLACAEWVLKNSREGYKVPDDLPHHEILNSAKPYLGAYISIPVNWEPKENTDWRLQDFLV